MDEKRTRMIDINGIYKRVAFTGHRPDKLAGYDANKYEWMIHQLANILEDLAIYNGTETIITGGAQGVDSCAANAVAIAKNEGIHLESIIYIPFLQQERKWSKDGIFSREYYRKMLKEADYLKLISDLDVDEPGARYGKDLQARNMKMVDDANLLIAIYIDDLWFSASGSGTANCMKYARSKNVPILHLKFMVNDIYGVYLTSWNMIMPT